MTTPAEKALYEDADAYISTSRVAINGVTYALRNIGSVRVFGVRDIWADACYRLALPWGVLFAAAAILDWNGSFLFLSLIGFAAAWTIRAIRDLRPWWHVAIVTNSGEVSALRLKDKERVTAIANAIGSAISQR